MDLSLEEAATRLGKNVRQIRYLIDNGKLTARKAGGRWVVSSEDLPLSEKQQEAVVRKERQLRGAVEEGLGIKDVAAAGERRFSVQDLKAFQITLPIHKQAMMDPGPQHPATTALHRVLEHLAQGCHRFDRQEKAAAYRQARDQASLAVCEFLLCDNEKHNLLVTNIEQNLMAAMAGLLRRLERGR